MAVPARGMVAQLLMNSGKLSATDALTPSLY
jgi:hypothetical protein